MEPRADPLDPRLLDAFVECAGAGPWRDRLAALRGPAAAQTREGRQVLQRHCIELAIDRLRGGPPKRPLSMAERWIATHAGVAAALFDQLSSDGRLVATVTACGRYMN